MNEQFERIARPRIVRIVGIYAAFSLLWIYASDRVLGAVIRDHELFVRVSSYKGWAFVLVSAALLWRLIADYSRRMSVSNLQALGNEARFQAIFEGLGDAVFICSPADGRIVDVNPAACSIYRSSRKLLLRQPWSLFGLGIPTGAEGEGQARIAATAEAPQLFEWPARRPDGSRFWVEIGMRRVSLGAEEQVVAIVRDITGRKTLGTRLNLVNFSLDHISDAVYWLSEQGRIFDVNAAACRVLGYRIDELIGQPLDFVDCAYPMERWPEHWQQLRLQRSVVLETTHRTRDGRELPVEVTANLFEYEGQEYNCAIARDISERKQAEKKLQASEQLFTTAFRISPDAVSITRLRDGLYLQVNDGFAAISGYAPAEVIGHTALELAIWDDPEDRGKMVRELRERGEVNNLETRFRRKDGRVIVALFSARRIEIDGEPCLLMSARDITARRQLESRNLRAAQLASIGQLAAGVAHEINNPINGVINYAQLLLNRSETGKTREEILALIIREADRVAEIVKELLFFSRDSKDRFTLTNVSDLVQSVLTLTGKYIERHGISLRTEIAEDLPEVYMIPQKIEQVLINLLNNASHALDEKYSGVHPDKRLLIAATRTRGEQDDLCRLVVRDNGVGIPRELLHRIVQPFFTTKPAGQGTGLGLSICREIVEQHRGQLRIDSVPGEFTEITIDLPLRTGRG